MGEVSNRLGSRTESDMKVLYIIFSSGMKAGGGHFYSLKNISESLSAHIDYRILNVGVTFAKPLKELPNTFYVGLNKFTFLWKFFSILKMVKSYKPEVIHAFDVKSLFVARTIALFYKSKVVFTKCGGPNGSSYTPDSDAQIYFSKENLDHAIKYGNASVPKYLIPNRVVEQEIDKNHLKEFLNQYHLEGKYIVMRISRFNPYYDMTFKQVVELFKEVSKTQENSTLVLIGQIQSDEYFEKLKEEIDKENISVLFVTDDRFTQNAQRLLPAADVIVATGRGVMEACSYGKKIFCPVKNTKLPIPLNKKTFNILFATNFSERAIIQNLPDITYNTELDSDSTNETREFFEKYFKLENVTAQYLDIYKTDSKAKFRINNYIGHALRFFKV